jgi:two-component system invasion response regulator UvrY
MRILLVDDHPVVRHGIRTILMERMDGAEVGEASTAADALDQIRRGPWDLVMTDISLPGASGLDLIKQLREQHPGVPALVVSVHPAEQFAQRAITAGAAGYLTKDSPPEAFLAAIERVQAGGPFAGAEGDTSASAEVSTAHEWLSDREYQILRLIGSGRTVSQISRQLGLSVKTISTYRRRALEKLGMRTNAELMRYAIENRLLDS